MIERVNAVTVRNNISWMFLMANLIKFFRTYVVGMVPLLMRFFEGFRVEDSSFLTDHNAFLKEKGRTEVMRDDKRCLEFLSALFFNVDTEKTKIGFLA